MKVFKLVCTSRNTNSFGLRGCILVAKDGEAWEIAASDFNCPQVGTSYCVPQPTAAYWLHPEDTRTYKDQDDLTAGMWSGLGWELPRRLPQAPQEAINQAFSPCRECCNMGTCSIVDEGNCGRFAEATK